jgi:hypothetical protein
METHWYFWENAVEHHGVTLDEVEEALDNIVEEQIQPDGRRRVWGWVEDRKKYFRVLFLPDGRLFNAFPDSPYTKKRGTPP